MTSGSILKHLIFFALPLMLGNIFQLLYNTVDTIVVGNFVGTEALAAVGSTTMIVNMVVFFFNGFSVGAGVVIGQRFGAKKHDALHTAIETTMTLTFILSIAFTIIGVLAVKPLLVLMATPDDVFDQATTYLQIYLGGISGLLVYNMGSGILRAVGDTKRPLYFLVVTSILNIFLDLFFVLVMHLGIAGVALATILSQFVSAFAVLFLLTATKDIFRFVWKDMSVDFPTAGSIFAVAMPAAIQSTLTSLSNVFVQSYVNVFGSAVMAGWSCYNKLDQYVFLPMKTIADGATTLVSQNIGAKDENRANKGTVISMILAVGTTFVIATLVFIFAQPVTVLFTQDQEVIRYSALFIHLNVYFLLFNCINHVLAGALRGRGDSKGPMVIMLTGFVAIRQCYLFIITHFFVNNEIVVALGYPIGWMATAIMEVSYYYFRYYRPYKKGMARKG